MKRYSPSMSSVTKPGVAKYRKSSPSLPVESMRVLRFTAVNTSSAFHLSVGCQDRPNSPFIGSMLSAVDPCLYRCLSRRPRWHRPETRSTAEKSHQYPIAAEFNPFDLGFIQVGRLKLQQPGPEIEAPDETRFNEFLYSFRKPVRLNLPCLP